MTEDFFYLKARTKSARAAVRDSDDFSHKDDDAKTVRKYLLDLARNLADQRPAQHDEAFHFVIRTMGLIAQKHSDEAYKPYGYKNPFEPTSPKTAARPKQVPTPPTPVWDYPVVNSPPSSGSGGFDGTFRQYSALKMFGYTVGKTDGWSHADRRRFLSKFMDMQLPAIVEQTFGEEYGPPSSAHRLRKVANVIASNASNRNRHDPERYAVAISNWEDDLAYLKQKYYEGLGLKFEPWPATKPW